ncbi:MAG: tRNA preQ1(34) S-adenosylmethionine ribosyltransferase-isomerase QueA [Clostridiaceae bacterium]|nr:tRNA preQ1(34) S-adenosylmethionine ribosyltransferase-isomerase QueA [Clostridiaceae bacterium]
MIRKQDFFFELPEHLIAQHPLDRRDQSRLLQMNGNTGAVEHHYFHELPDLLCPGDCLVLNNSKVLPARLLGARRDSGTPVEILLLRRLTTTDWEVIVHPGRRVRTGHLLDFIPGRLGAEVISVLPDGNRIVRFEFQGVWEEILAEAGTMPLPPYIHERLADPGRYQTVYASQDGSAAAPTAGLHFTPDLLADIRSRGIRIAELTLHVGLGTFRPVKEDNILDHAMHEEYYILPEEAVREIEASRREGGRIVSVGTTSCRVLEAVATETGRLQPHNGWTKIFIYPGYTFKVVDLLITNFHLPESTLIMLVSAFAGREHVLAAYQEAIKQNYRFFSFGDAMLISKKTEEGE